MSELKPCPFCGGEAELKNERECWGHGDYVEKHYVKCKRCGGRGASKAAYDISTTKLIAECIESWNRRSGEPGDEVKFELFRE